MLRTIVGVSTFVLLGLAVVSGSGQDSLSRWREVLGPSQAELPEPQGEVVWRADLGQALVEARRTERPVFVSLRCLPCKQCAEFDQSVLEGGSVLDPLLTQFVTVRLTDAAGLDLDLLPVEGFQDLDLSWWGWFLSPEGRIYGVFGGRDHVSDKTRISVEALAHTMKRVLEHHYDPRREGWAIDGPLPPRGDERRTPEGLPGYASWKKNRAEESHCLHCHEVADILRQPTLDDGSFEADDLDVWPLPENVGLVLDRDHGLRVLSVEPESAAAVAGLKGGDDLAAAGGRRLFGQADFRGVLHRSPVSNARIPVIVRRGTDLHAVELALDGDWKKTVLDWRMSVSQGNIGSAPGFWPNAGRGGDRTRLGLGPDVMCIRPWFGKDASGPAWDAGLRPRHTIVAVDGESSALAGRSFLVWFRLGHVPGDRVRLTVRDGDVEREIEYDLPGR